MPLLNDKELSQFHYRFTNDCLHEIMIKLCQLSPANIKYLYFITVEDNKSKDRESTSAQNDDQQSNSDAHVTGQATDQLGYQSKLNIHLTQLNRILTIILLSMQCLMCRVGLEKMSAAFMVLLITVNS